MKKIEEAITRIKEPDAELIKKARRRLDSLTKPLSSLGRLEDLAAQVVAITGEESPSLARKVIFTLAGDHGVVDEGVSAYPKEVTPQMVYNFLRGGAGINVLARHVGARVIVVDMGVAEKLKTQKSKVKNFKDRKINFGTKNFAKGPAMTKDEAVKAIRTGIELVEDEIKNGVDIIGTGDMGIGNTTASSAIAAAFIKRPVEELTGRGTGIDDATFTNKVEVIKKALDLNRPDPLDPIDVLSKVGGFEIGGLAGVILGGAAKRVPVVIDGFISGAACLVAYKLAPKIRDYVIPSHVSQERGHRLILEHMGVAALLDLNMRLGEGTGACFGISLAEAAIKILTEMATFESASVSERIQ